MVHPLRDQYTALVGPMYLTRFFIVALLLSIFDALVALDFRALLSPSTLRDRGFARGFTSLTKGFKAFEDGTEVPALLASAYGRVLELGPGAGHQCHRYDVAKISHIFGVEPNEALIPALHAAAQQAGLADKYTVLPCGTEDFEALQKAGVEEGTFDCVLSVQVLCTVPRPQDVVGKLYRLLKPGGRLIVWEHVECKDPGHKWLQWLWGPFWSFALRGCQMGRPIDRWLAEAGHWERICLELKPDNGDLFPRINGFLIKAKE